MKKLFTSESVTVGHPDKMCDIISDSILDTYLKHDKKARVACEVCVSHNTVFVTGEITSSYNTNIEKIVRKTIIDIGYDNDKLGFNGHNCNIIIEISEQSSDIALGVDEALESKNGDELELGAGDQGIMFGYACNETKSFMPLSIHYAHLLAARLTEVRKKGIISYLRPDGKTQITTEYKDGKPIKIHTILISAQHDENIDADILKKDIIKHIINKIIPKELIDEKTKILINPTGRFVIGGPVGDSGLTGRKIIVDTYGGYARHGGGAFSGKDYTKVDRSAAYYARYVAKNIVASKLASKCEIGVSYAIGVARPISLFIDTFGTSIIDEESLLDIVNKIFDFRPTNIINELDLSNINYKDLASFGHMGRTDLYLPWEKIDKVEALKELFKEVKPR